MRTLAFVVALALPLGGLHAAGGGNETAPATPKCQSGFVYDKQSKKCLKTESSMDTDLLYETVRQLAYAERYFDAQEVLALMPQGDDRTLTYLGFTNRKLGHVETAMAYYRRALDVNPGNVLARSYMAQGFVEQGRIAEAMAELHAIRAHGGTGTWAEASLKKAIATGKTFSY